MYYLIKEIPCGGGDVCDDCKNNIYISNNFKKIICISCGSVYSKPLEKLEIVKQIEIDFKTFKLIKSFLKLVPFEGGSWL